MRAKQIGTKIDRNPAKHTPKPRNSMPNIRKLIDSKRLVPIYNRVEDTIMLVGYRRKASSRKAHQRPFMLKQGIPIAKIPTDPETEQPSQ